MYKRITFAVLIVSMIGCAALKERFGTGEETPELKAARAECRSQGGQGSRGEGSWSNEAKGGHSPYL